MKFKRLLTAGLMALFCVGTATAASQLSSVQVTPKENSAAVSLQTTGSFAHKEYRPDEHLLLVDLTGVSSDPALMRTVVLKSPVLKSYQLSSYTSPTGSEVTRVELALGDNVTADVIDVTGGLQILLSSGGAGTPATGAAPVSSPVSPSAPPAAQIAPAAPQPSPAAVATAARDSETPPVEHQAGNSPMRAAAPDKGSGSPAPNTIRKVSVQQGPDTLDVTVDGPSSAQPYLLKNPDRLVMDFSNTVLQSSVRNIAVHSKDVLKVRVGFHASPPVTRVVIDLRGPHVFEVVPSADQVVVRIKPEAVAKLSAPSKIARTPVTPPAASAVAERPAPETSRAQNANVEAASAPNLKTVAMPVAGGTSGSYDQAPISPVVPQVVATAATTAPSSPGAKAAVELARTASVGADQSPDSASPASSPLGISKSKYTGEPISVNLKDVDLKDFFRLIHEISGLNIVLDPSVRGSVTLVLDDVPWDQALDIVLKNNALDRELQGNVLRIAATDTLRREAVDRRAQSEAVALAVDRQTITRSLSYAKAREVAPTIKKFLTARGDVISDERTNALIISDIPSVLPNLDRLISQLDKKTQEVEIEVRVVSASRSFSRDLGFQLGFNWGNGVSAVAGSNPNGANLSVPSTTSTTTGGVTTTTSTSVPGVPLFSNFPAAGATTGLSLSNITKTYGIDAILTAAESHSLAKVLSRPRVVTQSNVKAEVKQGVKIPVYTSGTANANASVSYLDAVLRLSVTPQITADNTIFLTVDVENTQPEGAPLGNGNFELATQQTTTQVLVSDGATVVIGGVIQTTNSVSTTQTPILGSIPWLGNLFKERSVQTSTNELIFFITPKIIQI